jgi:hypothetical protein
MPDSTSAGSLLSSRFVVLPAQLGQASGANPALQGVDWTVCNL